MIRVLQCVNNMHRAGLETMLMNYYRNIDREKIQFDFLAHRQERSDYDDEIERMGGRIYRAPRLYPQNYRAYFAYMKQFFREHPEHKIVHSHIDAMSYLPLLAAKKANVPVRIAHSHSASVDFDAKYPIKQLFRLGLGSAATHYLACGQAAGKFLFRGNDFQIIPNAVDADAFRYKEAVRRAKRQEMGLEGKLVLGHVGRFTPVKNHEYLLDVFSQVLRMKLNSVLLLVGTGELEQKIRNMVESCGLSDYVRFLGNRSDVNDLYQSMDVFVMPSLYEGLPLVGVEAQFAGLPCVFSDEISREVQFTEKCCFLGLDKGTESWAKRVIQLGTTERAAHTVECQKFDMKFACQNLEAYYKKLDSRLENPLMVCK